MPQINDEKVYVRTMRKGEEVLETVYQHLNEQTRLYVDGNMDGALERVASENRFLTLTFCRLLQLLADKELLEPADAQKLFPYYNDETRFERYDEKRVMAYNKAKDEKRYAENERLRKAMPGRRKVR